MTGADPLAAVRADFAAGLGQRIEAMRTALDRLEQGFAREAAEELYRAAHSLTGTAGSFGAEGLARAAGELESLTRGWLTPGAVAPSPDERRAAEAVLGEVAAAAAAYRATVPSASPRSPASRLAVVGELTTLIHAAADIGEIFRSTILKVERVLDFRRASVVLVEESGTQYSLHTLYDKALGGFFSGEGVFPIEKGMTGEAIRTGRPIRVDALQATEGILLQHGRRVSAIIVPLHVGDRVIGALNFGHEEPGRYNEEDLDWAVVVGRQIETLLYYSKLLNTVTEQREALAQQHAAVERQRNQLEALIDASDAAIMLVGPGGNVAHANAQMAQLVGIPREALFGASLARVHHLLAGSFADRGSLAAQERALSGGGPLHDQVEFVFPRRAVWQRAVAPVRDSGGSPVGHILLYRDVTREVEADRAKSEFVSVVSHELRTPMTSVKTSLSLLLAGAGGPLGPTGRELLEIALRNAERLIRLVNDLLDLSRLDAGRMELQPEPVALQPTVEFSAETVASFAAGQGVTLHVQPPAEAVTVRGVRDRVEQVIVNLLSNAIKFSPRGGRVAVRWWRDGGVAVTEVSDQGPGIPADMLTAIFEPFRQLDSSSTREHGGAGLGLTISQRIVQALGGDIWAESELGQGSRFFVRLPLGAPEEAAPRAEPAPQPLPGRVNVLVAHSDADWRRLAAARLEAEGWRVLPVTGGAEGLAQLRDERVDLVVAGIEFVDMHGLDFVKQLRGDPRTLDIPVLMVGQADATARALEFGPDAWIEPDAEKLVGTARGVLTAPRRAIVLLVEDDPAVRRSVERLLQRSGYASLAVSDGHVALHFARQRRPNVIIADYRLPGMNGVEFLRLLRGQPGLGDVPAIMLTGSSLRGLARELRELGVKVLAKPVEAETLLKHVRKSVGKRPD